MHEKNSKILGTLLFLVLISGLIYLVFFRVNNSRKQIIRQVEVTGNRLLSGSDYLNYTGLSNRLLKKEITLPAVKARFERHPYVLKADVEYLSGNIAKVVVTEKNIEAILIYNGEPDFLTSGFELLPVLQNTRSTDFPVIRNLKTDKPLKLFSKIKNGDIEQAYDIIEAAKLSNKNIAGSLSEINLRNGGEIILSFSGVKPPVLFGKGDPAKKMVYLDSIWDKIINGNNLAENSDYIDLRFSNEIYIGTAGKTGLTE